VYGLEKFLWAAKHPSQASAWNLIFLQFWKKKKKTVSSYGQMLQKGREEKILLLVTLWWAYPIIFIHFEIYVIQ